MTSLVDLGSAVSQGASHLDVNNHVAKLRDVCCRWHGRFNCLHTRGGKEVTEQHRCVELETKMNKVDDANQKKPTRHAAGPTKSHL